MIEFIIYDDNRKKNISFKLKYILILKIMWCKNMISCIDVFVFLLVWEDYEFWIWRNVWLSFVRYCSCDKKNEREREREGEREMWVISFLNIFIFL